MELINDVELLDLMRLEALATQTPWKVRDHTDEHAGTSSLIGNGQWLLDGLSEQQDTADRRLIAAARNALPKLIDTVAAYRRRIAELEATR